MPGRIVRLQIKPAHGQPMQVVERLEMESGAGIAGDVQRGSERRQVLLIDRETLDEFGLEVGRVRENVTVQGLPLRGLAAGRRLRLGAALAEVTKECAPCDFIERIRPGLRQAMQGRRGILLRVVEGGTVAVGDEVRLEA